MDNLRPSGALRWKWRPLVGKVGECDVTSQHLQGCSPPLVSVKNRRVGPREQVLNVLIAYWWYEPSKASSLASTCAWLKRTASMVVLGEKLRHVPWTTQPGWEVESGALFLGSSTFVQPCWWLTKGCYMWTTWDTYGRGAYADWAWKACGMLVGFFPTGCTSIRIVVTLGYEYRLFVAVIT
jgi:hypothetical protein